MRTAISRAYYGALGTASAFLDAEGQALPTDNSLHGFVWDNFRDSLDDRRYYIGEDGYWLRRNRNAADYEPEVDDLPVRSRKAVVKARSIIGALERILNTP